MENLNLFEQVRKQPTLADGLFVARADIVQGRASKADLMKMVRERAQDPSVFDEVEPVFFTARISNNQIDAYFTRMAPSSLRNYAADAKAGISFQDSHRTNCLGLGYSLDARYVEEGEMAYVEADFYVVPGLPDVDAFIRRLRTGIARDVSIGFYGGREMCSICGENMWGSPWRCPHWPGEEYEVEDRDDKGNVTARRTEKAIAWVEDARLAEVSAVYDGATPGAVILKAQRQVEAGEMTPAVAARLNQRYRALNLQIPTPARKAAPKTEVEMPEEKPNMSGSDPASTPDLTAARSNTSEAARDEDRAAENVRAINSLLVDAGLMDEGADVVDGVRSLVSRLSAESEMAKVGREYRSTLIETAVREGVRAFGDRFDEPARRSMLDKMSIEDIRTLIGDWSDKAVEALPAGRQTREERDLPAPETGAAVPTAAFLG